MSKKVLAIFYSQTGQLRNIIDNCCAPFEEDGVEVEKVSVKLRNDYLFPWTGKSFFSVMPDCVLGIPSELLPFELKEDSYDLIIVGYQAWFLSPSIPFNSFIQHHSVKKILKNTPVVTITGARNMWINAFLKVKEILADSGAKLVGNIALVDTHMNLVSFVTIFHWMLHGKKDRYLHLFPKPGVSDSDIANSKIFGRIILTHLQNNNWEHLQAELLYKKAMNLKYHLMFIESKAGRIFKLWANFISTKKNKTFWLSIFKYYLLIAFFVAAPFVFVIDRIIFKPFFSNTIRRKKQAILTFN